MSNEICPMCDEQPLAPENQGAKFSAKCDICMGVHFCREVVRRKGEFHEWHKLLGAVRELNETCGVYSSTVKNFDEVHAQDQEERLRVISRFPNTIAERAQKLLACLASKTQYFGQEIEINHEIDYPIAYAKNPDESAALLAYLVDLEFVRKLTDSINYTEEVVVTASGHEAASRPTGLTERIMFISSTCHDLVDCRAELGQYLESLGCIVRLSDDPYRFNVDLTVNSIEACLRSVETSDVVICIIDGRYGRPIPSEGKSATHLEVLRARERRIPVIYLIRDEAEHEFWHIKEAKKNSLPVTTKKVEPRDENQRNLWFEFVSEIRKLKTGPEDRSNWLNQFRSVVDLKAIVRKRLHEYFVDGK